MMKILSAKRIPNPGLKGRPNSPFARQGVNYEKTLVKCLKKAQLNIEHNPWFAYTTSEGSKVCCPDILIPFSDLIVVVECKLTFKYEAVEKLKELYVPVIKLALLQQSGIEFNLLPLVIARNLIPNCPQPTFSFHEALMQSKTNGCGLLQWLGGNNKWL